MTDTTQRPNGYPILVTFPADWPDERLAGRTITFRYPSEGAALLAASGFRLRGASA